jgi:hypothetical protein
MLEGKIQMLVGLFPPTVSQILSITRLKTEIKESEVKRHFTTLFNLALMKVSPVATFPASCQHHKTFFLRHLRVVYTKQPKMGLIFAVQLFLPNFCKHQNDRHHIAQNRTER